jgi:hypothetical protein
MTGIPARTFETMRLRGTGPKFLKLGKRKAVRYRPADIAAWLARHERRSTSDKGAA